MEEYCRQMGFRHRITTPEDTQANRFTEAFMKVLVKLVHMAMVDKRDPKRAVIGYLMAYRATPHMMMGKSPAELMFGMQIQTKLLRMMPKAQGKVAEEARKTHEEERRKQKTCRDAKRGAKEKKVEIGDQVMLPQRKTTVRPPWDADPWTVTEVKGSQLRVQRGEKKRLRAKNLVKIIKQRV